MYEVRIIEQKPVIDEYEITCSECIGVICGNNKMNGW